MSGSLAFFRFVAKAALNCVGFGVAGDFVAEVLPEMAREVYRRWVQDRNPQEVCADVQAVARLDEEEARRVAQQAAALEAGSAAPEIHLSLVAYLTQLPAAVRQTQRRLGELSGMAAPAGLTLTRPADVLALLPPRPPRFRKGQRAPGFPDWELEELLGIGGFGEVWKARNRHLPPVALKFCLDASAARFLRNEADLLGQVVSQGRHPGIVALLDTALTSDPPCLKYEYVTGGDLAGQILQWHRDGGRILSRSLDVMRQLADVLAFAHRLRPPVVHRDLKPANVLLQADEAGEGRLKVADFGIGAVVSGQAMGTLAATHAPAALRGSCTPLYASPQQMRGEDPNPRDDVFALGVMWFQMLTGELAERPGADWREELAGRRLPGGVLELLGRCLAAKEERRLPHAGALADALSRLDVAVPVTRPAPPKPEADEEVDEEDDEALDLAEQVQRSLRRAQETLSRATHLAEQQHDYAAAVRCLERLPEPFRNSGLADLYRERRDRAERLRGQIRKAAAACNFAGLRDRIEDLLALVPGDEEMRRLHAAVPWVPGQETANSAGMRFVLIPAGRFLMGSPQNEVGRHECEGPVHEVDVSRPFYLGVHPVTQEQYQRVTGTNPSHFRKVAGCDTRTFPVESVSWEEAVAFCARLAALPEERQRGRTYRLPAEAEWEYACRAGTTTAFSVGRSLTSRQANFDGRKPYGDGGKGEYLNRTSAVGAYPPNAWGLYDVHGNVWEWCNDWYAADCYRKSPRRDPAGPRNGEAKVLRGGSWQNHGRMCRSGCRDAIGPGYHGFAVGFRVVLEVSPPLRPVATNVLVCS